MKKIAVSFISLFFMMLSLCACGGKGDTKCVPDLNKPFCLNAEIDYDGLISEAKFQRNGNADWKIEFSSPNTLSGVILTFKDSNVEASYKGLSFSVPKSALPLKSIISTFIDITDTVAGQPEITGTEKNDMVVTEGDAELGKYEMCFDKNGCLTEFSMPNLNLSIKFTQCSDGSDGITNTTEPTTESVTETEQTSTESSETADDSTVTEESES